MTTTTLDNFWWGWASTTGNVLTANYPFFAMVFMTALVIMLLGGLIMAMTMFFRRRRKKK